MVDWKNVVVPKTKEVLSYRREQGVPTATLRGIFYILVSLDMIENLQQRYKDLSRALVTARRNGVIPYDWIVDESREIIDIGYDTYRKPGEMIVNLIYELIELPRTYKDMIPRWYKQPDYVEIWVEKNAMASVFSSILTESRQVRIVPNGGWSSESFMKQNLDRLRYGTTSREWDEERNRRRHKEPYVLYYGDYDPTGLRMVENLRSELEAIDVNFEHVAITKEQIERFGLQHLTNPDPAVMAKLERDSNAASFMEDNDGRLFQIELDALNALMPDDFITLLENSVDIHFDEEIHTNILQDPKYSSQTIWGQVCKTVKNFDKLVEIYKKGRKGLFDIDYLNK